MSRLSRLWRTVRYLKSIQLFYQLYYRLISQSDKVYTIPSTYLSSRLKWHSIVKYADSYSRKTFNFLNITQKFDWVDWNFSDHGKLWLYNLCYFDYVNQESHDVLSIDELLHLFASKYDTIRDGREPYPTSLRLINWVKYLSEIPEQQDDTLINIIYQDMRRLAGRLEFHLLGNHYLENGFGLLFASYFFKDEKHYTIARDIISTQLSEQILPDGAHYEGSPMYHKIILHRVLDSIHLIQLNEWKTDSLLLQLQECAARMLCWIKQMSFDDGSNPLFNDAAEDISLSVSQLSGYYGAILSKEPLHLSLKESGYRVLNSKSFTTICDVADIMPSYQPGHAHADTFNYELADSTSKIVVDSGTMTYEHSERRVYERSTEGHNTVSIDGDNSSEVWSSFRVGRRAKVTIEQDQDCKLIATHDGYRYKGITHRRTWTAMESQLEVQDEVFHEKDRTIENAISRIHLHPAVEVERISDHVFKLNTIDLLISGNHVKTEVVQYQYSNTFNRSEVATCIEIKFNGNMRVRYSFN